jgi:hypothetical protein
MTYNQRMSCRQYLRLNNISSSLSPLSSLHVLSKWKDDDWKEVHRLVNERQPPVLLVYTFHWKRNDVIATEWWPLSSLTTTTVVAAAAAIADVDNDRNVNIIHQRQAWLYDGNHDNRSSRLSIRCMDDIPSDNVWCTIPPFTRAHVQNSGPRLTFRIRHGLAAALNIDNNTVKRVIATMPTKKQNDSSSIFVCQSQQMVDWMDQLWGQWWSLSNGMILIAHSPVHDKYPYLTLWSPHSTFTTTSLGSSNILPSLGTIVWESTERCIGLVMLECHNDNHGTFFFSRYEQQLLVVFIVSQLVGIIPFH